MFATPGLDLDAAALRGRAEVLNASMQIFRLSDAAVAAAPRAVDLRRAARAAVPI